MLICLRELLEKYSQCKTSAEVITVQDEWLEAERRTVKSDAIDYPPSCSSSSADSDLEEEIEEGEKDGEREEEKREEDGKGEGEREKDREGREIDQTVIQPT